MCTTSLGRALLGWYCTYEDYCCFLALYPNQLPATWREENIRKRAELARLDYPTLSQKDRLPRLLADIWPRYWGITFTLTETLQSVFGLKSLNQKERIDSAKQLELELRILNRNLQDLLESPEAKEILQMTTSHKQSSHHKCCPKPPFEPRFFLYPPAGQFAMVLLSMKLYLRWLAFPALWDIISKESVQITSLEGYSTEYLAVEVCRIFAGLETNFSHEPEALLPSFAPLVLSALTCPIGHRPWLWYKFAHFEKTGGVAFDPIKKTCALVWKMPEIATEGFDLSKEKIPVEFYADMNISFMHLTDAMEAVKLARDAEE
jgi:hypothetical protein